MHWNPKKSESFLIHADWQMSCCSPVQSDRNPSTSRSHRGGLQFKTDLSPELQPALSGRFQLSSQFPPHLLQECVCSPSLWCHDKWREGGGGQKPENKQAQRRGKVMSPLLFYRSISSWKSPHLLWALLHSSPIVGGKTHFLAALVCVCVQETTHSCLYFKFLSSCFHSTEIQK